MSQPARARALLIILDGFGVGRDDPFNAIKNARMPFYTQFLKTYPHAELLTHGAAVGLPDGVMGNSEVGHMAIGAGRILYQDLTRISRAIADRSFFQNPALKSTLEAGSRSRVHLMGLLSDGGVHSTLEHLLALLDFCLELKIPNVSVHAFLDGRDTPPKSAASYLESLLAHPAFQPGSPTRAVLASLSGRYFAMDRDKRWDRVEKALGTLCGRTGAVTASALTALSNSYAAGKTDEFLEPVLLDANAAMKDGDSIVFFNFRADRAREISELILKGDFVKPSAFCGMTQYDAKLALKAAYMPDRPKNIFPELLEQQQMRQFRIAETEKYAHVTYFFSGGREKEFAGEDRVLIASPKDVPTYDLKPEMSARPVTDELVKRLESGAYDFCLVNFANPDMVGHTGNYDAAIRAMEVIDECLARVIGTAERNGYHTILTADHGNIECMRDHEGHPHTQHTLNPVPVIWAEPGSAISPKTSRKALHDGTLPDIAPTLCEIMGLSQPLEMTGKSLISR